VLGSGTGVKLMERPALPWLMKKRPPPRLFAKFVVEKANLSVEKPEIGPEAKGYVMRQGFFTVPLRVHA